MKCCIVRDLLPGYIKGEHGEETNEAVKKHLDDCAGCRAIYETMMETVSKEIPRGHKHLKINRRTLAIASVCILIAVGFCLFAKNYRVPLPYDANRMSVEEVKLAVLTEEDGGVSWRPIKPILLGSIIAEDSDNVMDAVQISYRGINNIGSCSRGRTVNRNGEEVRVVYYCYSKTLWDSLFVDSDLLDYSESADFFGEEIYGDDFENEDYKPGIREIYYLPTRDLTRIDELSDEEFDKLRETCDLIWSGVI